MLQASLRQHPLAVTGIALGNLVPLFGVLYWGWSLFDIFYLYWYENVIIGVFTLIRMLLAGAREGIGGVIAALFMCAFFTAHYGMFCMGHGMIMTEIFYPGEMPFELTEKTLFFVPWLSGMTGFVWALAGIVVVEAIYNIRRMIDDHAGLNNTGAIMFAPYGRIVILHLTIILGGILSATLGFPPAALMFLIVLKIFYDIGLFFKFSPKDDTEQKNNEKDENALA